jgi:Flp pilus assembly protein TadG
MRSKPTRRKSHKDLARRRSRGASVLEFALALPVFFFAMMGTVEFGRGMFAANQLNHLAREAVRYAIVRSEQSDMPADASDVAAFIREMSTGLVADDIKITTRWDPGNVPGAFVEVSLRYRFEPVLAFLPESLKDLRGYARGVVAN